MSSSSDQWVILELSWSGDDKSAEDLENLLKEEVDKDIDFFLPSTTFSKNEDQVTVSLFEGYIFAEAGYPASTYFNLESLPYISKVLTRKSSSDRHLLYVDQEEVDKMKNQLREETVKDIEKGDEVKITDGVWENLTGKVIGKADPEDLTQEQMENYEGHIYVEIEDLESMESIVTLPKVFLEKV